MALFRCAILIPLLLILSLCLTAKAFVDVVLAAQRGMVIRSVGAVIGLAGGELATYVGLEGRILWRGTCWQDLDSEFLWLIVAGFGDVLRFRLENCYRREWKGCDQV